MGVALAPWLIRSLTEFATQMILRMATMAH
jgi:hypothetical protein